MMCYMFHKETWNREYIDYILANGLALGRIPITPTHLRSTTKCKMDYIFGDNTLSLSYMVGYVFCFPQHIDHQGSYLPSIIVYPYHISCYGSSILFVDRNPKTNILVGAVIGLDQTSYYMVKMAYLEGVFFLIIVEALGFLDILLQTVLSEFTKISHQIPTIP